VGGPCVRAIFFPAKPTRRDATPTPELLTATFGGRHAGFGGGGGGGRPERIGVREGEREIENARARAHAADHRHGMNRLQTFLSRQSPRYKIDRLSG